MYRVQVHRNIANNYQSKLYLTPISVSARSKALVYTPSFAGIAGSNNDGGMDFSIMWLCVLSGRGLYE